MDLRLRPLRPERFSLLHAVVDQPAYACQSPTGEGFVVVYCVRLGTAAQQQSAGPPVPVSVSLRSCLTKKSKGTVEVDVEVEVEVQVEALKGTWVWVPWQAGRLAGCMVAGARGQGQAPSSVFPPFSTGPMLRCLNTWYPVAMARKHTAAAASFFQPPLNVSSLLWLFCISARCL